MKPVNVTAATFDAEVYESPLPVVVDLWAPWCGPCKTVSPILEELAETWAGKVKVVKIDTDKEPMLAAAFQVRGVPTIAGVKGQEIVSVQVGFNGRASLEALFTELAGEGDPGSA